MFGARKTVVLCSAALLVACEPVSEPEVDPPLPTLHQARGAVASSVVGSGNTLTGDGTLRNFSFTALEIGGLVDGEFDLHNHSNGFRVHGIITCFFITGANANEAFVGGQVTQPPPANGVVEVGFRVTDQPGRTPDEMSDLITHGAGDPGNAAQLLFCDGMGPDADKPLIAIERGSIRVFDNPQP
ncbi:MAG: hypothetical protein IIA27_04385 [Gemmatimonadetes bacterium]|nr:hypothetical protein [Gemmatimonadota bacterium]